MDHSFPGHVGMGVGTAGTAVPHPVHRSDLTGTAEHPDRQRDRVAQALQHGHPLPSYMQSILLQEKSFFKLSESSGLVLSFG